MDRIERARELYDDATFRGDATAMDRADRELDAVQADLALARGRIIHARFLAGGGEDAEELRLFEVASELFGKIGDPRGEGEALFWTGLFHQVVRGDDDRAVPFLQRARKLTVETGDALTLSYVVRHLSFAEFAAGRTSTAREFFEESVRLREELGFVPGVAAGKLALAELAAEAGDRDEAVRLLNEAAALAESCGARGVTHWIEQARAALP